MKKLIFAALVASFSFAAHARPSTWTMTCAQAQGMVETNGAIVMNYGYSERAGFLYDRFVAHGGYCFSGDEAHPAWAATSDNDRCRIGFVCRARSRD